MATVAAHKHLCRGRLRYRSRGLWAQDSTGALRLLLRTGAEVPNRYDLVLQPAPVRLVRDFTVLHTTPGVLSQGRTKNAVGVVVALVYYMDGEQALLRISLP